MSWHCTASTDGALREILRNTSTTPLLFYEIAAAGCLDPCLQQLLPLPVTTAIDRSERPLYTETWTPTEPALQNGEEMQRFRSSFIDYLEALLCKLMLSESQRTDLITTILPRIRYEQVLFRFLRREELEWAAKLTNSPEPNPVLRVFLLYGNADLFHTADFAANLTPTDLSPIGCSRDDTSSEGSPPATQETLEYKTNGINGTKVEDHALTRETDWESVLVWPNLGDPGLLRL